MENKTTLQYLKGIGPRRAALLARLGLEGPGDLLGHFPRRYEDRSNLKPIAELTPGETETVTGVISRVEEFKPRPGLSLIRAGITDGTGACLAVWFNRPYLKKQLPVGERLVISGKVAVRQGIKEVTVSDFETVTGGESLHTGRIVPVYPSTEGLNQKFWREIIHQVSGESDVLFPEVLSDGERAMYGLCNRSEALREIHFPTGFSALQQARARLVFDEFYLLQLALSTMRMAARQVQKGISHSPENQLADRLVTSLPFSLTGAQRKVITEIKKDMEAQVPMQRLIQGDVGSGKTVIAAWALLKAVGGGYQGGDDGSD